MESKELRIGNYVSIDLKGGLEIKHEPITASGLLDFHHNKDKSSFRYKPIPLTEEWLVKFGFKKNETYCFIDIKNNIQLMNISNKYFRLYYRGVSLIIDIYYVHQLQNLYFDLTQKELTI